MQESLDQLVSGHITLRQGVMPKAVLKALSNGESRGVERQGREKRKEWRGRGGRKGRSGEAGEGEKEGVERQGREKRKEWRE